MHYVYILYSPSIDRFYVGESIDPESRLKHHNAGHQRYTRRATDWVLVFRLAASSREEAQQIEQSIKKSKSRKSTIRWIRGPRNEISTDVWQHFAW